MPPFCGSLVSSRATPRPMETVTPEEQLLAQAERVGLWGRAKIYSRLSGPGWLQGAVTLGGGSLAGALYLGILAGPHLLWVQPLAMLLGVVMLGSIGYVVLSTGERPVDLVSRTISPVLTYAWIIATIVADVVFCAAQFALAGSTVTQNLIPSLAGSTAAIWIVGVVLAVVSLAIVSQYESGAKGIAIFENILKVMVALVVVAFVGVVGILAWNGRLNFGALAGGFVPDFSQLFNPTDTMAAAADATGAHAATWRGILADEQRERIIAAFGAAVGINMTFLLPFSLLKRGWGRLHRPLAIFDLALGLFVPFVIATSCLVIAAASQFYGQTADVFAADGTVNPTMKSAYESSLNRFLAEEHGAAFTAGTAEQKAAMRQALPAADREIGAMLASRDAGELSSTLRPLLGDFGARVVFGGGVFAMAWSSMIIHMLMNGLALSALLGRYDSRKIFMIGASMPALAGVLAPVLWTGASRAALAIPASVIATVLLPVAYLAFLLLMNSRRALGDALPRGGNRWLVNTLLGVAFGVATFASVWGLAGRGTGGQWGMAGLALLTGVAVVSFAMKSRRVAKA